VNNQIKNEDVRYFEARYFHNDLDKEDDYYLKVSSCKKNVFVKKEDISNGRIY
tara:strand:+ start:618 stop:776 length:159 start_codon:yes stop_codon:yes gene_type:complete